MGFFDGVDTGNANMCGIITGVVKDNYDKDHPGMVKVEYFLGETGKNITGWVPVMTSYAGADYGIYTLPEVDTEVVIGFSMGDRNFPIVLGCLWNKKNKLPDKVPVKDNYNKMFKTKGGFDLEIKEESGKSSITFTTPGKTKIEIDDEKKLCNITDENSKNAITMDLKGGAITIKADKKMDVSIGGKTVCEMTSDKIDLKAGTINVNGDSKCEIKSNNITVDGAMVNVKGSSSGKIESSGMLTIKGSMVKIN